MSMTTNNYRRTDSIDFATKVSRKIDGWYSNDVFHDKAVNRIVLQREEIISLGGEVWFSSKLVSLNIQNWNILSVGIQKEGRRIAPSD